MSTELVRIGCSFSGLSRWIGNISNMFDISPTLQDFVSGLWLHPPGNRPILDLYGLSVTLHLLSCTVTVLFGRTCCPVLVKYSDSTSRQDSYTN